MVNDTVFFYYTGMKFRREDYSDYTTTHFGKQTVRELQLCSMGKGLSNGYYHIEHSVSRECLQAN